LIIQANSLLKYYLEFEAIEWHRNLAFTRLTLIIMHVIQNYYHACHPEFDVLNPNQSNLTSAITGFSLSHRT